MVSQELLDIIKKVDEMRIEIAAKTPEGLALLRSTYLKVFNENYTEGCGPCHEKAFYRLIKILNNPKSFIPVNKKYILKDGHQVSIFGSPDIYTNANLTDEVAEELLKERPALKNSFQVIDGKEVAAEVIEEIPADDVAPKTHHEVIAAIKKAETVAEAKAVAEGDVRKSVIDALAKRLTELQEGPKTKVLTQEDLDADPNLSEQGFKVGDTVAITEEE